MAEQSGAPIAPGSELPAPAQRPVIQAPAPISPAPAPVQPAETANPADAGLERWTQEIMDILSGQANPARRAAMVQAVKERYQQQVLHIAPKGKGPAA